MHDFDQRDQGGHVVLDVGSFPGRRFGRGGDAVPDLRLHIAEPLDEPAEDSTAALG